jgi:hypothetical protein
MLKGGQYQHYRPFRGRDGISPNASETAMTFAGRGLPGSQKMRRSVSVSASVVRHPLGEIPSVPRKGPS